MVMKIKIKIFNNLATNINEKNEQQNKIINDKKIKKKY